MIFFFPSILAELPGYMMDASVEEVLCSSDMEMDNVRDTMAVEVLVLPAPDPRLHLLFKRHGELWHDFERLGSSDGPRWYAFHLPIISCSDFVLSPGLLPPRFW
jgi:hypothetical protein